LLPAALGVGTVVKEVAQTAHAEDAKAIAPSTVSPVRNPRGGVLRIGRGLPPSCGSYRKACDLRMKSFIVPPLT
jgi:hypothetical protein